MKWFINLKTRTKLIWGFGLMIIFMLVVMTLAYINIFTIKKSQEVLFNKEFTIVEDLLEFRVDQNRQRYLISEMMVTNKSQLEKTELEIKNFMTVLDKNIQRLFELGRDDQNFINKLEELKSTLVFYRHVRDSQITLIYQGKIEQSKQLTTNLQYKNYEKINSIAINLCKEAIDRSNASIIQTEQDTDKLILSFLIVGAFALLLSILIVIFLNHIITKPIEKCIFNIQEVEKGHFINRLNSNTKDEIGILGGTLDKFTDYLQNTVIGTMKKISEGDVSMEIVPKDNQDEITPALNTMINSIKGLILETGMLTKAAIEGKLNTRGNVENFKGGYKEIIQGVNNTLDAVIGPLNVAAEYIDRISKGELPKKITDNYNGDFNEIKNNLNNCIENIYTLISDANMLSKAAVEGKLSTRADASKHQGDYRKIVEGVNATLDAVIGPLNVAAEYVDRISKGELPKKITDNYNGDFNEIKNNLNNCIENIYILISDANMLSKAAVEGKLSTRADASKHQGDYRKIVEGVNATLDAVIIPLNVAAEYVDRISKGELPKKITDNYNGDFNEIKNNLNNCIENIYTLISDANMLSKAAVEGKLSTRADASKHQGDYRKIVEGVNATLDAVIIPLNVAADYVDKISKGDIPKIITDNYNGDFNKIKINLNNCIENINLLVADANMLSKAGVEGKLKTRADASKHQGDYRKIVEGVNNTLDKVISPINDVIMVVQKIAEGNLSEKIAGNYQGDFATLENAINNMIENLRNITYEIREGVNVLSSSASEILAATAEVASGASETAAAITETTATVQEVKQTVQVSDQKAQYVFESSQKANQVAQSSKKSVKDTIDGMNNIKEQVESISESVVRLSEQSQAIGEIITSVNDLAEQSNLLAVNAAIEAAKAGEQGRGFSVVAQEVKSLADQSKHATAKVRTILNDIQKAISTAVMATEQRSKAVDVGVKQSLEAQESIRVMTDNITEYSQASTQIVASSQQQLVGMDQVALAMENIKQASNQNVISSKQSEIAAVNLHELGQKLKLLVEQYKL